MQLEKKMQNLFVEGPVLPFSTFLIVLLKADLFTHTRYEINFLQRNNLGLFYNFVAKEENHDDREGYHTKEKVISSIIPVLFSLANRES